MAQDGQSVNQDGYYILMKVSHWPLLLYMLCMCSLLRYVQSSDDTANLQVHVALQHFQRAVSANLLHLEQCQATLHQPADALVPQVVQVKIIDTGTTANALER